MSVLLKPMGLIAAPKNPTVQKMLTIRVPRMEWLAPPLALLVALLIAVLQRDSAQKGYTAHQTNHHQVAAVLWCQIALPSTAASNQPA